MYYILGPSKVVYDIYVCRYTHTHIYYICIYTLCMYIYAYYIHTCIHSIAMYIYTHIYISKSIYKSSHTTFSVLIKVYQDNLRLRKTKLILSRSHSYANST